MEDKEITAFYVEQILADINFFARHISLLIIFFGNSKDKFGLNKLLLQIYNDLNILDSKIQILTKGEKNVQKLK